MDQSYTCRELDKFRKDNCLSSSSQEYINAHSIVDKQGCKLDHESRSREVKPLRKKENGLNDDQVSASSCMKGDHVNNVEEQCSVNLSSRNSAGQNSTSFSNENASSTVIFGGNSKDCDVSMQSLNGVACGEHISAKSDISSDTGPPVNGESNGLDAGTSIGKQKRMTESSCSNSIQAVLPVASSNDSYHETSTEAKSSDHHTCGSSSSIPACLECSTEEPVGSHAVSVMDAQITQKAVDNIRARGKLKVSGINRHQNAFVVEAGNNSPSILPKKRNDNKLSQDKAEHSQEVDYALGTPREGAKITEQNIDIYHGASECTSLNEESNDRAINDRVIRFGNQNKFSCITESKEEVRSCYGKDEGDSGCNQHIVDSRESIKNEQFSVLQCPLKKLDPAGMYEGIGLSCAEKSSESIMAVTEDVANKGQTACPAGFDLNEDIHDNEFNGHKQLVCETGYSCNVIRVVAKSGVPLNFPMTQLKFEGELGWKGSAATSAFRPTHLKSSDGRASACKSDCSLKQSKGFIGIDLNVAAAEDSAAYEMHGELGMASVPLDQDSSLKVSSSRAERLSIDLNCLGDFTGLSSHASLQVTSPKNSIVDLNLNEHPSSADTCDDLYRQYKTSQHMDKMTSDSHHVPIATSFRDHSLSFVRPAYCADLSSVQFFGQAQTRPFLVAAPNLLQPMEQMQKVIPSQPHLPYIMHALPSRSYPSSGPFFIGPSSSFSSSMHYSSPAPYARDPRVHTVFPQIMNHNTLPSFSGTPHFMQVVHGRSQNEVTNKQPIMDVVNGENSAANENMRESRQYLFPSRCSTVEEQMKSLHQGVLGANTPLKRREPDGGWDSYQLGNKQLNAWN